MAPFIGNNEIVHGFIVGVDIVDQLIQVLDGFAALRFTLLKSF